VNKLETVDCAKEDRSAGVASDAAGSCKSTKAAAVTANSTGSQKRQPATTQPQVATAVASDHKTDSSKNTVPRVAAEAMVCALGSQRHCFFCCCTLASVLCHSLLARA
jgi:hypothetical protein